MTDKFALPGVCMLLVACGGGAGPGEGHTGGSPTEEPPPEMPEADRAEEAFAAGLRAALGVTVEPIWRDHLDAVSGADPECPAQYSGNPGVPGTVKRSDGRAWMDTCTSSRGEMWSGGLWWKARATEDGGATRADRDLDGEGDVATDAGPFFSFDGHADDTLRVEGDGWTWGSYVQADYAGQDLGWRAEVFRFAAGGDNATVNVSGEVWVDGAPIVDRFDAIDLDLAWAAPEYTNAENCALEPRGWISLRSTDGNWYDLVFSEVSEPVAETGDPSLYGPCDGCGDVYGRSERLGALCPDFGFVWEEEGLLGPPDLAGFAETP